MKTKKLISALITGLCAWGLGSAANAAILTDIIMVVDESGSMGDVQANLRDNIGEFAQILSDGGIDAQYGLVGYGSSSVDPRMLTDLTSPTNFATAAQSLQINGGTEPGYTATAFALNEQDGQTDLFSFRTNALKNIIIFTDEPSNGDWRYTVGGSEATQESIDTLLSSKNALFNAVLDGFSTRNSYSALANNNGGNVYDLSGLNTTDTTVVEQFVNDFANSKLQEIRDFCDLNPNDPACTTNNVPEPGSLVLFGMGLLGFGAMRRRWIS